MGDGLYFNAMWESGTEGVSERQLADVESLILAVRNSGPDSRTRTLPL